MFIETDSFNVTVERNQVKELKPVLVVPRKDFMKQPRRRRRLEQGVNDSAAAELCNPDTSVNTEQSRNTGKTGNTENTGQTGVTVHSGQTANTINTQAAEPLKTNS